jgi:maltooligosyltrehalose trehalohydrolase
MLLTVIVKNRGVHQMAKWYPPGVHRLHSGEAHFVVWAPAAQQVELNLLRQGRYIPMQRDDHGYNIVTVADVQPGERYLYRLDGENERPDPASRYQPEGVHGPSVVVDDAFAWEDDGWIPPTLRNTVFYELHVGTFTPEGTFDAIIPHLSRLRELGITTIELMPVAEFPGARNWGYDGVSLYAAHHAYGGPDGLKRLVNACHRAGLAVWLDVVYNHLGPEGNYLWDYGPYFTDRYHTPWGASLNLDGAHSDHVRGFFIENALYWLDVCHIDGLRLDATHALFDFSAVPFLTELAATVHDWAERANRRVYLIAETDRSDRKLLLPREANGAGLDGQWLDDLHHAVHFALTGETDGYYADYDDFGLMLKVLREGYAYSGEFSPARQRRHGTPSGDILADRFVVCAQNHDQVGNRMLGERLSQLTDFDGLKLAAALVLCSPYVPLLFMGEEYGETAPFLYFVSHGDADLVAAVRQGRTEEFAAFAWRGTPPDPQAESTFQQSKLNHHLREQGQHATLHRLYGYLLGLRRDHPALTNPRREDTSVYGDAEARIICLERRAGDDALRIFLNFHREGKQSLHVPAAGSWRKVCDSNAAEWRIDSKAGKLAPDILAAQSITLPPGAFVIYQRIVEG